MAHQYLSTHKSTDGVTSEQAHDHVPMEWWFIQGRFVTPADVERYFMMALFQHRSTAENLHGTVGHTLLLSHMDPRSGRHWCRSQISAGVRDILLGYQEDMRQQGFEGPLVDIVMAEIKKRGPLSPVVLEDRPVHMDDQQLDFSWADTALMQKPGGFDLRYASPEDGSPCHMHISPATARVRFDLDAGQDQTMAYATIPRAEVQGRLGPAAIQGQAWFDHQWGGYAWFLAQNAAHQILGWDWFGINLDDGSNLLLVCHRDMKTLALTASHAVYQSADGRARQLSKFSARPLRIWESPTTLSRYPVAWQLDIPEINTWLTVEPLTDDQELPVFGLMRAVWEGACTAAGTKNDRPVFAQVRMELHGYGYVFDFKSYLDRWVGRIDGCLSKFLPPVMNKVDLGRFLGDGDDQGAQAHTRMVSQPVWDMMGRGGKRWRPVFGCLLLNALGSSHLPFEPLLAATIELSHLGSLMIDDIEDQSPMRRGQEAIYLKYGLDLTINTGNTLYFLPLLLLENHPNLTMAQREAIYGIMIRHFVRIHFGQGMDIYWSKFVTAENFEQWIQSGLRDQVLKMYADKTAAPVVGLARVVCLIAQADDQVRQACVAFAEGFGVAFQVMDDVLNFSTSSKWTKVVGEDLAAGKLTYVILSALEVLPLDSRNYVRKILCDSGFRQDPVHLQKGIDLIRQSGALETCRQQAQTMVQERWRELARLLQPSEAKIMLHLLCAKLTDLPFES